MVTIGQSITLTYRIKNLGTLHATGVTMYAPLPAGLRILSVVATGATYDSATQRAAIGNLAPGADAVIKVRVQATRAGMNRLCATVTANEAEDNLANNQSHISVMALPAFTAPPRAMGSQWMFGSKYR